MGDPLIYADDVVELTLERFPAIAAVFVRHGMACVGCEMARFDTIRDVARAYNKPTTDLVAELDAAARQTVAESLSSYATLLRNHIYKEDNILYPMADQAFTEEDQSGLAANFERVEREEIGEGVHERYAALARELAGR